MANFILIRHNVADYSTWKKGYDSHKPARDAAGLTQKYLLQDPDDKSQVVMLFEAADIAKAKAFCASTDLKEAMRKFGVVGKPDLYFLKD